MSAGSSFPQSWACDWPLRFACPRMPKRPCSAVLSGSAARSRRKLDSLRATLRSLRQARVDRPPRQAGGHRGADAGQGPLGAAGRPRGLARRGRQRRILEREERIRQKLASDARMNAVLKTAADGIIVTDDCGVIETFNAAAQAIFGYHAVEIVGKRLATLLPLLEQGAGRKGASVPERGLPPRSQPRLPSSRSRAAISAVKSRAYAKTAPPAPWNWPSARPAWRIGGSSP